MRISDWSSDVCSSDLYCSLRWRRHGESARSGRGRKTMSLSGELFRCVRSHALGRKSEEPRGDGPARNDTARAFPALRCTVAGPVPGRAMAYLLGRLARGARDAVVEPRRTTLRAGPAKSTPFPNLWG